MSIITTDLGLEYDFCIKAKHMVVYDVFII